MATKAAVEEELSRRLAQVIIELVPGVDLPTLLAAVQRAVEVLPLPEVQD